MLSESHQLEASPGTPTAQSGAPTSADRVPGWEIALLLALMVAHAAYAGAFIRRSSIVIGDERYYCLFDDAVISMQYARNWTQGHGPVWNEGERVEGYSNFLWMGVMALAHLAGRDASATCLLVQIIGEIVLLADLILVWALGRACGLAHWGRLLGAGLLSVLYVNNYWALEGMETAFMGAVVCAASIFIIRAVRNHRSGAIALLILSIAPLVRPEGPMLLVLGAAWMMLASQGRRKQVMLLAALSLLPMLLHLCWRHRFYGDWLPNTYYLKVSGISLSRRLVDGLLFTGLTLAHSFVLWVVVLIGWIAGRQRTLVVLASFAAALLAYQWWVGGDAWSRDRFVLPAMPGLVVAGVLAIEHLSRNASDSRAFRAGLAACFFVMTAGNFNYDYLKEAFLLMPPFYTQDNEENLRRALAIREFTKPDATVAVSWAGVAPYFSERKGIDLLGKCDKYIAHLPASQLRRAPGHNKWDVPYSLDVCKPDVVAARRLEIFRGQESFVLYNRYYATSGEKETYFWVRFDSRKVYTKAMYRTPKTDLP